MASDWETFEAELRNSQLLGEAGRDEESWAAALRAQEALLRHVDG